MGRFSTLGTRLRLAIVAAAGLAAAGMLHAAQPAPGANVASQPLSSPLGNLRGERLPGRDAQLAGQDRVEGSDKEAQAALVAFVRQVLERHPQLLQAEAESRSSSHRVAEARSAFLPRVTVSANLGRERQRRGDWPSSDFDQRVGQARLLLPLHDPAISAELAQRQSEEVGSDWRLTDVREQLVVRTVEAYVELSRAVKLVELAQENLRAHREYVAQIKEIARSDLGRAADLPSAVARVALAEAVLTSRLARLESARTAWWQLTGLGAPQTLNDLPLAALPASLDGALELAYLNSAALRVTQADLERSRRGVDAKRAAYSPRVNFEVNTRTGRDWGGVAGTQTNAYAGVSLEWVAFSGFADRHGANAAIEGVVASQHAHDRVRNEVRARVEQAWYELQSAESSLRAFESYADNARLMLDATQNQFKIGRRTLLEVLNAENELFTARTNVETVRHDLIAASWRLLGLQGRIVDDLGL